MDEKRARFEAEVLPHLDAAYRFARWLSYAPGDADDVVQEAILRANIISQTAPHGPVYINLNLELQEDEIAELPPTPAIRRFAPPPPPASAAPVNDRAVSVTSAKAKYTYAAYGDGQAQTKSTDGRIVAVPKEGKK